MSAVAYGQREAMVPAIRWLRDDCGLMWKDIGSQLGIDLKTAHDYYHDPTGEKHHERQLKWRPKDNFPCATCDGRVSGSAHRRGARRCGKCIRGEWAERRAVMVEMRRADFSNREIAAKLGVEPHVIATIICRERKKDPTIPVDRYMRKGTRGRS